MIDETKVGITGTLNAVLGDVRKIAAQSGGTFYFEPKSATNKVRDDAVHFIVGFEA